MGAIGLNGAAAAAKDPAERNRLSSMGWMKWAPFQTAAFASHLLADLAIAWENKGRIAKQDGVARDTVVKTAVAVLGAAVTLYSGMLGKKVEKLGARVPKVPPSRVRRRPLSLRLRSSSSGCCSGPSPHSLRP